MWPPRIMVGYVEFSNLSKNHRVLSAMYDSLLFLMNWQQFAFYVKAVFMKMIIKHDKFGNLFEDIEDNRARLKTFSFSFLFLSFFFFFEKKKALTAEQCMDLFPEEKKTKNFQRRIGGSSIFNKAMGSIPH